MEIVSEKTRGEAWLEAVRRLRAQNGLIYNLIVEVTEPGLASPLHKITHDRLDSLLKSAENQLCDAVAETLFPAWEYVKHGSAGVYSVYPDEIFPAIRSLPANSWDTYAYRLVRRVDEHGNKYNPLERLVTKLKKSVSKPGPKKAVYELDALGDGLATYDPATDWNTYMGGQCLSHISLKIGPSNELFLTALYRYQYFVQKAYGNFLGLARLQDFIAREAGLSVGPLVCHATLARLDKQPGFWGFREIDEMIAVLTLASESHGK